MGSGITKTGDWDKFGMFSKPSAFQTKLQANVGKATQRAALLLQDEIRGRIIKNEYGPITRLAVISKSAKKKSSKALIDTGALVQNVTFRLLDPFNAFVGIMRSAKNVKKAEGTTSYSIFNLALVLHNGTTITVTERMRKFFIAMAIDHPGEWHPLKPSTKAIHIPPRPFIKKPIEDKTVINRLTDEWKKGLKDTFEAKA